MLNVCQTVYHQTKQSRSSYIPARYTQKHQEILFPTFTRCSESHAYFQIISTAWGFSYQTFCGRNVLAHHLARYIRRRRKHPPTTAARETAQFVRVPPTRIQLRNLYLMTENPESAAAPTVCSNYDNEGDRRNDEDGRTRTRTRGTYQRREQVRDVLDPIRGSVHATKITPECHHVTNQLKMET
jgi:hypothetical protein